MEIRDPVHGSVSILDEMIPIIRDNFFQRLRNIKQLGFSEYVFPGATHTRFIHSIGVMKVGEQAFDRLFPQFIHNQHFFRLRETFKLGCLLHDIGHAPLSHSTEVVMPSLEALKIPKRYLKGRDLKKRATHEDYTIKSIVDASFGNAFDTISSKYGVERMAVADLIIGQTEDPDYFIIDGINYFPILHQLISGELDCDRMDYLLRDSYFCGVSYGNYDLDWLLDNLRPCNLDDKIYLGISERAVVTFDDFLLSRYHMFVMVYFHYRPVCLEQLLYKYFDNSPGEYEIPANIEEYVEHDDHFLMKILRNSNDPYAKAIVQNNIPPKLFESFNETQLGKLEKIQQELSNFGVDYIRCSSLGRLSKYYTGEDAPQQWPMKVVRQVGGGDPQYFNIENATDLFNKFSESHAVNRLHCHLSDLPEGQQKEIMALVTS